MMGVLLLRLSGPLQSWGDSSRFTVRGTRREPTKSGVIGLVAAALGRQRGESVSDLCALEFGVRSDQPGTLLRDFQTERSLNGKVTMPLSQRYYLADAKFLAALGGDDALLFEISQALRHPRWPLCLGRRSCPADVPLLVPAETAYADVRDALARQAWLAADWYRRRLGGAFPELEVACDGRDGEACESQADLPLSFGDVRRYAARAVVRYRVPNPDAPVARDEEQVGAEADPHDPMGFF